jgi:uncharacterized membrane protein
MSDATSTPGASSASAADLPPHIEATVQAIARLHAAHQRRATPLQILVDRMTAIVARPAFVGITFVVIGWIVLNLLLERLAI